MDAQHAHRPPRSSLPALAGLLAVTALAWPTAAEGDAEFALSVVVAVWALGEATRSRRAAIDQASRRAALQEQARLARELHDVIAHSVSWFTAALIVRWSRRSGWEGRHRVALVAGAFFTSAWGAFIVGSFTGQTDLVTRTGNVTSPSSPLAW